MTTLLRHTLLLCCMLLSACVTLEPTLPAAAPLDKSSGYIAGSFTRSNGGGFGYVIINTESGTEYVMPFGADTPLTQSIRDQLLMIQVPAGQYRVAYWLTYGTRLKERSRKEVVTNKFVATPFAVGQGSVVFLGSFSATMEQTASGGYTYTNWSIKPNVILNQAAHERFATAYPAFSEAPFSCANCIESLISAALRLQQSPPVPAASAPAAKP